MLIVNDVNEVGYSVLDTDDMVSQRVSGEYLLGLLRAGLQVYGVTEHSLVNNYRMVVIFRFAGAVIFDYDGYLVRRARGYSDRYQIINWMDFVEQGIHKKELFLAICKSITSANPVLYDLSAYDVTGKFSILLFAPRGLSIKGLGFRDFNEIQEMYLIQHVGIRKVTIDKDKIECRNHVYTRDSYLRVLCEIYWDGFLYDSNVNNTMGVSQNNIESLDSDFGDIESAFADSNILICDGIPLYCSRRKIVRKLDFVRNDMEKYAGVVISVKNNRVYMNTGVVLSNWEEIVSVYRGLRCKNTVIKGDLKTLAESSINKANMYKKELPTKIDSCSILNHKVPGQIQGTDDKGVLLVRTKTGLVILNRRCLYAGGFDRVEYLYLGAKGRSREGNHSGVCYSLKDRQICIVEKIRYEMGYYLLRRCKMLADQENISYYGGKLVPLALSMVKDNELYVSCGIWVEEDSCFRYVFDMPLLYLGCKMYAYANSYVIPCFFEDIVLEKGVMENQSGYFDRTKYTETPSNLKNSGVRLKALESLQDYAKNALTDQRG